MLSKKYKAIKGIQNVSMVHDASIIQHRLLTLNLFPLCTSHLNPLAKLIPYLLLLSRGQRRGQATGAAGHKDPRAGPLAVDDAHVLRLILPSVLESLTHGTAVPHAPDALPDALADDAGGLGAPPAALFLEDVDALVHLLLAQLGAVAARAGDDVGVAREEELGHLLVLLGAAQARGDAAGVEQLPEEVGRVGVGVAAARRLDARVESDEEHKEVGREGVCEWLQVGVC